MRILITTDAFPPRCGGSGWSTFYLARALLARGHRVELIQPRQGTAGVRTRLYEDVLLTEWGYSATPIPGLRAWHRSAILEKQFASFVAESARSFNVIHAQHLLTIPPSVAAGHIAGIPVVSTVRDYWPVCLYGTLWRENDTCPGCVGTERLRCLRQRYGSVASLAYPALPFISMELARRQRALQQSNVVIAVSDYVASTLAGIVNPSHLKVVPNLVDLAEFEQFYGEREQSLVFIGKLNREKGADWLPEIMARTQALKVRVVGEGELAPTLAHIPNLELCGWLPNAEALNLLARSRALLLPSRWPEPLSRVLLEAQALGTPTVALDTGGTRDIIQHEVNGLLVKDLDEFCTAVTRVLTDDVLCAQLSAGARRIAEERFSAPVVTERLEAIYQMAN